MMPAKDYSIFLSHHYKNEVKVEREESEREKEGGKSIHIKNSYVLGV